MRISCISVILSMSSRFLLASLLASVIVIPTTTAQLPLTKAPVPSLWDLVSSNHDLFTMETAMMLADVSVLSSSNNNNKDTQNYTLLAPDNEAFGKVNGKYLQVEWARYLRAMMEYHILPGSIITHDLVLRRNITVIKVPTLFTGKFVLLTDDDPFTFNDRGMIVDGNIPASNGVLHELNNVLIPPTMQYSLLEQLEDYPGTSIFFSLLSQAQAYDDDNNNKLLDNPGPWTVFVPSNRAFANYDIEELLRSKDKLLAMVRSHITDNIVLAYQQQQSHNTIVTTLSGETVAVTSEGIVYPALTFQEVDTLASNGVWHLIDTLLIPESLLISLIPVEPENANNNDNMSEPPLSTDISRSTSRQGSHNIYNATQATNSTLQQQTPAPLGRECNDLELAFAPDCCPLRDVTFEAFCISIFNRPSYNSSGMIEAHAPWIGSYPIAGRSVPP
jgi:uncharacterized surface protein with fasciclin (FAS1) repeats